MSRTDEKVAELERQVEWLRSRMPVPLAGEFLDTASAAGDDVRVRVFGWDDGEHAFGPVKWSPLGGVLPQAGDECVIVERDDGVWQVVAWWSDQQAAGGATGAAGGVLAGTYPDPSFAADMATQSELNAVDSALDARLDALEAKRTVSGSVASDGTESSSDFSVVKNATGDYSVTFTTAFASAPNVVPGTGNSAITYAAKLYGGTSPTTGGFRIFCHTAGTPVDGAFTFIAHGTA